MVNKEKEKRMKILLSSVARTGSTLVYQLLQEIFIDAKIERTHNLFDLRSFQFIVNPMHFDAVITTFRNFNDVIISMCRVQNALDKKPSNRFSKDDIINMINKTNMLQQFLDNMVLYRYCNKLLVLKYEMFYKDYDVIFNAFEQFFNITIESRLKTKLKNKYSFSKNKQMSNGLSSFYEIKNNIHGNHLYKGETGAWKNYVDEKDHAFVESLTRDIENFYRVNFY